MSPLFNVFTAARIALARRGSPRPVATADWQPRHNPAGIPGSNPPGNPFQQPLSSAATQPATLVHIMHGVQGTTTLACYQSLPPSAVQPFTHPNSLSTESHQPQQPQQPDHQPQQPEQNTEHNKTIIHQPQKPINRTKSHSAPCSPPCPVFTTLRLAHKTCVDHSRT